MSYNYAKPYKIHKSFTNFVDRNQISESLKDFGSVLKSLREARKKKIADG